jgi:AraC-like DNA-binding protein
MLYLRSEPGLQQQLPFSHDQCTVVSVSPLMRELILRTVSIGVLKIDMPSHQMLHELMFDELRAVNKMPLQLPYPTSKPAKDFIKILEQSSQNSFDIGAATKASGVSRRTLERLFPVETGMSLGQWVRRRKLLEGLQVFSEGATIADVAYRLGYSGPSAFISMFRRELGNTPRGYLSKD